MATIKLWLYAIFLLITKVGEILKFNTLDEAINCYGRENLIPITSIKQICVFSRFGCQPKFVWEKEDGSGRLTCWYLKSETQFAKRKWDENRPVKTF